MSLLQGKGQSIAAAGTVGLWQAARVAWVEGRLRQFSIVASIKAGSTLSEAMYSLPVDGVYLTAFYRSLSADQVTSMVSRTDL